MTAVEWLEKEIFRKYKFTLQQLNCQPLEEAIKQAKEMEKQQIVDASNSDKYLTSDFIDRAIDNGNSLGEQYYNETFNK
jgi:hypothetical protein